MRKFIFTAVLVFILGLVGYFLIVYYVPYSEGYRAGELVKITHKGFLFKTWEGEISQGVSEAQRFKFSVESSETEVLEDLKNFQGQNIKLTYIERLGTFFWLGDTKYFITKVEKTTP